MQLKISGEYCYNNTLREEVWKMFLNENALVVAIPGCKSLELVNNGEYKANLSLGIAAIRGEYAGIVKLKDLNYPLNYKMFIQGSGGPGYVKGEALISLEQEEEDTVVKYDADIEVGGKIAGVGQRIIGGIAKLLIGQFFRTMEKQIKKQNAE